MEGPPVGTRVRYPVPDYFPGPKIEGQLLEGIVQGYAIEDSDGVVRYSFAPRSERIINTPTAVAYVNVLNPPIPGYSYVPVMTEKLQVMEDGA